MMREWEREWKARQALLDARDRQPPALAAAVRLWQVAHAREDAPALGELLEWLLLHVAALESELAGALKANALLMKGMESQCELMHDLKQQVWRLERDLADARTVCDSFARRIAAQSELLSKRAERPPDSYQG